MSTPTPQTPLDNDIIVDTAMAIGGKNFFLSLIESLNESKNIPLLMADATFEFPNGTLSWSKPIFHENYKLLIDSAKLRSATGNILPSKEDKRYKKIFNMVRAMKPLYFTINTNSSTVHNTATFSPLIGEGDTIKVHPVFKALFALPIEATKEALSIKG
jgi:hypothetical protein